MFVDSYHSRVCFAPQTLNFWGHDVQSLSWETCFADSDQAFWDLVCTLQKSQQNMGADAFMELLNSIPRVSLACVLFQTENGSVEVEPGRGMISVRVKTGEKFSCKVIDRGDHTVSETIHALRTARFFVGVEDAQRVERQMAKLQLLGSVRRCD